MLMRHVIATKTYSQEHATLDADSSQNQRENLNNPTTLRVLVSVANFRDIVKFKHANLKIAYLFVKLIF